MDGKTQSSRIRGTHRWLDNALIASGRACQILQCALRDSSTVETGASLAKCRYSRIHFRISDKTFDSMGLSEAVRVRGQERDKPG